MNGLHDVGHIDTPEAVPPKQAQPIPTTTGRGPRPTRPPSAYVSRLWEGLTGLFKRFHRMRVSRKLMLISVVFMIPDSVLLTLFLRNINSDIDFAQREQSGNEYQRPLEQLLEYLPAHRLLAQRAGANVNDAALESVERSVDTAFRELAATNARIGASLEFTQEGLAERQREHVRVDIVESEWLDLKAHLATLSGTEREARHLHLLADVRTMITHAGDTSNLVLDPDLDSYYLMDVTLLGLPQIQDRLASIMAYDVFAPGHVISRDERNQLVAYTSLLKQADLDRVVASAKRALSEDAHFYGRTESLQRNIPPLLDEFSTATEEFIRMTWALSQADHAPETAETFRAAGERARQASFRLWTTADKELDGLLQRRVEAFRTRRARSLILTAFAALAAIGFVSFITRSISVPLQKQATDLQRLNQSLEASGERYKLLVESTQAVPWEIDVATHSFWYISPQVTRLFGYERDALVGTKSMWDLVHPQDQECVKTLLTALAVAPAGSDLDFDARILTTDRRLVDVRSVVSVHQQAADGSAVLRGITVDVTRQKKLELELRQAQKLESVGRLAAGVAHEINTPVQFVSDSMYFARDAVNDLAKVIRTFEASHESVVNGTMTAHAAAELRQISSDADVDYLLQNIPKALDRSLEGLNRVATIVRSMKEFAHPDQKEMTAVNLNQAIESTLIIACSEYKYVAEIKTDLADIPLVTCHAGDINQVILNIVVNAAHAIEDVVKGTTNKGRITVETRREGDTVAIRIGDTGMGIPTEIGEQIFDPFFTTKEVGKGTGQGLAIARSVILNKHGGELTFESQMGKGTMFTIRLPLDGARRLDVAA